MLAALLGKFGNQLSLYSVWTTENTDGALANGSIARWKPTIAVRMHELKSAVVIPPSVCVRLANLMLRALPLHPALALQGGLVH